MAGAAACNAPRQFLLIVIPFEFREGDDLSVCRSIKQQDSAAVVDDLADLGRATQGMPDALPLSSQRDRRSFEGDLACGNYYVLSAGEAHVTDGFTSGIV
jgi:hypothetical protein